jgi:predicted house-cleaning noncanonical NTP pyrophosphatase (MazG superfamily)
MIKISHELPLSLLEYSMDWNDYEYCLPHLLDKHADYRQYFLDSRERDRFIIMDNGLFEGVTHTIQDLLEKIDLIKPDIFIVPDEWNDSTITAKNAKHWLQYKMPMRTKLMVVLQGKTVSDIHLLYKKCVDLGYTHFAFNHSSIVYQELGGSENALANQSVGRVLLIQYLLQQNVIKDHHYIHLLGASTPQEFTFYRDAIPTIINSVDTSNPIICGALGIKYTETGLLEKPKEKIEEFMEENLDSKLEDIIFNINKFKEFCNK